MTAFVVPGIETGSLLGFQLRSRRGIRNAVLAPAGIAALGEASLARLDDDPETCVRCGVAAPEDLCGYCADVCMDCCDCNGLDLYTRQAAADAVLAELTSLTAPSEGDTP